MKTFKDLEFKPHPMGAGIQARMDFENGYGVSVIQTPYSYTSGPSEYELAVFHNGSLCYDTPVTNDVEGHLSADEVSELMKQVQELPAKSTTQGE